MSNGSESAAHGFIWSNGQVIDLGAILPGATGVDVRGINNRNSVCGFSVFDDPQIIYRKRACLWSNGQSTDLGTLVGFVNIDDLLGILMHWGPAPQGSFNAGADLNHDGVVNIDDLLLVITHWS